MERVTIREPAGSGGERWRPVAAGPRTGAHPRLAERCRCLGRVACERAGAIAALGHHTRTLGPRNHHFTYGIVRKCELSPLGTGRRLFRQAGKYLRRRALGWVVALPMPYM